MLTDTKSPSMRVALQQIYVSIYVEFVVKNPLSPIEHRGGVGVNNELFVASLDTFVVSKQLHSFRKSVSQQLMFIHSKAFLTLKAEKPTMISSTSDLDSPPTRPRRLLARS